MNQTLKVIIGTSLEYQFNPINQKSKCGSVSAKLSSDFNGTSDVISLEASNDNGDGGNWFTVFQDDDVTPCSYTLNNTILHYIWNLKNILYRNYRVVYTNVDGTTGTLYVTLNITK